MIPIFKAYFKKDAQTRQKMTMTTTTISSIKSITTTTACSTTNQYEI